MYEEDREEGDRSATKTTKFCLLFCLSACRVVYLRRNKINATIK